MAHSGVILFIGTVFLAVASSFSLRRAKLPGKFDIRATANDREVAQSSFDASVMMRVAVSILVLLAALFIILSKQYEGDQQKWAFGAIGTVLGYWLKT